VFSSAYAFAALRADGSVVTWGEPNYGGDSSSVADKLDGTIDVVEVFSNNYSFSALRADGSVVTWGDDWGGDSSSVATELSSGVLTLSNIEDNTNLIFPVGINTINSN
jgi:alpha-tubulin suppressor-like RCC1 family protein